jgi:hypothetical protein
LVELFSPVTPRVLKTMKMNFNAGCVQGLDFIKYIDHTTVVRGVRHVKCNDM